MIGRAPTLIAEKIADLRAEAQGLERDGNVEGAWSCLGDAHVLSQPWAEPHVRVHAWMLGLGWRTRSVREVVGQVARLLVAGPGSVTGRFPVGNSGRSNVSAFTPAPVRADFAALLIEAEPQDAVAVLEATEVRSLYDRMAPFYDVASKPYGWFGARRLAKRAIEELRLEPGDIVVELGTGTGRNLETLSAAVGSGGRVVGVDLSPGMLKVAQAKVDEMGLGNVVLVEEDMTVYEFPKGGTGGVLSTYAMEMLPTYEKVISSLVGQVRPGGRIVLNGLRHPDRWPDWVTRAGSALSRPFGVSEAYESHRPWEVIERLLTDVVYDEAMSGAAYLSAGTVPETGEKP
ncbi:MAG: DUF3703 domain-containing protein [Acidimicrobiales bacterium]|nr:MAG: DUF3703 domain-containing protein [Acidimicrobiales bacterium]